MEQLGLENAVIGLVIAVAALLVLSAFMGWKIYKNKQHQHSEYQTLADGISQLAKKAEGHDDQLSLLHNQADKMNGYNYKLAKLQLQEEELDIRSFIGRLHVYIERHKNIENYGIMPKEALLSLNAQLSVISTSLQQSADVLVLPEPKVETTEEKSNH